MLVHPGRQVIFESFLPGNFHPTSNLFIVSATTNQSRAACSNGYSGVASGEKNIV